MLRKIKILILLSIISVTVYGSSLVPVQTDSIIQLYPDAHHAKSAMAIVSFLSHNHYERKTLDDSLSSKIFDNYIENLDPNRLYFLDSDIKGFNMYRYKFDDLIIRGNLLPAYQMFNTYLVRFNERMDFVFERMNHEFDFNIDESFTPDRSELAWAKSVSELDEIWRKRLKNESLGLILAGKKWDAVVETLKKRYNNYIKRMHQLNSEDAFQQIMNSYTEVYDPHTNYLSPKASEDFMIQMSSSLEGIGAVLSMEEEYTKVVELVAGGPAERSKLINPNDKIIGVGQDIDGEIVDVIGWRLDDIVRKIRGPKGTTVRLELIRTDAAPSSPPDTIALVRDVVIINVIKSDTLKVNHNGKTKTIGVIEIPKFYANYANHNSTTIYVDSLLQGFKKMNADGIIIDVRGNGGGYLSEAINLTGLFIEDGPVVQVRESNGRKSVESDRDHRVSFAGPLAVLVDRISASASEIFAAAIQDYDRGIIIGTQTFGKGTVQRIFDLDQLFSRSKNQYGQIKYTMAKFYRVTGSSTQHMGVIPDIILPSRYTAIDIGERTSPYALEWDKISGVDFTDYNMVHPYLADIQNRLKQRLVNDQNYSDLVTEIDELEVMQNKNHVSLNEENREKEYEKTEQLRKQREERRKTLDNGDFVLTEAAEILGDLIELEGK